MSGLSSTLGGRWWAKALGLLLVPVLIAAGLLAATWKSDTRLSKVQAAIVNLDKAVTINGQTVPMGRQLSAQLISAEQGQNFTWILADATSASDGLKAGRYAAVVTIPQNFSAAATSYAGTASAAQQATIDVATSPVAGIADTAVGQSVAQAAAIALNQTLTSTYLDQVYVGFNTTGQQFQTVADAATKLSDGSKQLSDGLYRITSNGDLIKTGGSSLVSGIGQYTSGASQSASGASQLASGLAQLSANSAQLRSGVTQLDAGIGTYRAGLVQYTDGVTGILSGVPGQADLLTAIRQLTDQALAGQDMTAYGTSVNTTAGTAVATTTAIQSAATDAGGLAGTLDSRAQTAIDTATATLACPGTPGSPECIAYAQGVAAATGASKTAVTDAIEATSNGKTLDQLISAISSSAAAQSTNNAKVQTIVSTTTPLVGAANNTPSTSLLAQEKAGATALIPAGAGLVAGLDQMRAGVSSGQLSLEYGINAYTGGVDQSAAGAQQLSSGMGQLSGGGAALLSGAQQYVSGVNQLVDGVGQVAPGASQLADGTKQLADGLAKGATQVPSYTTADRTQLSKVVASPISVSSLDGLVQPGAALAALLMVLALWAGALATYTVLPAVRRRLALSSSATAALVVDALRPGLVIVLVQALLVSAVGEAFVRLYPYRWFQLTLVLLVAAVAFVAVNHALAAWAKGAGRVVGVAVAVVTLATALTSTVPGWLDAIRPLSPLSPAYDAVRASVSGGPGITAGVFTLIAWTLLGALFSVAAILRARTVSPAALATVS